MAEAGKPDKEAEEVADRLQGLSWYRVDFSLFGSLEVKAEDKDDAAQKALENYDWADHVDDGEIIAVEEEI